MTAVAAKFRGYDDEAKKTRLAGVGSEKRTTVGNRQKAQTDSFYLQSQPLTFSNSKRAGTMPDSA